MTNQPTEPTQDVDVDVTVNGQDDDQPELPEQHEVPDTTVRPDSQPADEQGEDEGQQDESTDG